MGLVGEAFDAEGALEAVVGLQPLGVGQAHPAAAQRDDDLRGHDLGREAALLVRARIERGLGAEQLPQAEPFAERGHGHLTAMHRVAVGGGKFNAQFGIVEGVERHVAASRRTTPRRRCTPPSPKVHDLPRIVTIRGLAPCQTPSANSVANRKRNAAKP